MSEIWIVLNFIFMIVLGFWAKRDFENGYNWLGWLNLFFSAWNAAAFASAVL